MKSKTLKTSGPPQYSVMDVAKYLKTSERSDCDKIAARTIAYRGKENAKIGEYFSTEEELKKQQPSCEEFRTMIRKGGLRG